MDISVSIAIIAALITINTLFMVIVLFKAIKVFGEIQKLIEMVRLHIVPVSHDVTHILGDVRSIVKAAEGEMGKVGDSITAVRDTAVNLKEFEEMIQERIEQPLLDVTSVLSALVKGGRVFWNNYARR
ncbi:DUF948 domain-containing protein [candidate division KSB1 bacterium]|nr:DUF948 domain-containing protein [candidate division KSB1 bacterium]